jgi:hypothetical protein
VNQLRPASPEDAQRERAAQTKARKDKLDYYARTVSNVLVAIAIALTVVLEALGVAALRTWLRNNR